MNDCGRGGVAGPWAPTSCVSTVTWKPAIRRGAASVCTTTRSARPRTTPAGGLNRFGSIGRHAIRHGAVDATILGGADLRIEARRFGRTDAEALLRRHARRRPLVPLISERDMTGDVSRPDRLVESQGHDERLVEPPVDAIPISAYETDRRRREREDVRLRQLPAADGGGARPDSDDVVRRVRQDDLRIGCEHEDRRSRPAKGAGDRRPHREERRRHLIRQRANRHHRLGEPDANLVGLRKTSQFTARSGGDDGERRGGSRRLRTVNG